MQMINKRRMTSVERLYRSSNGSGYDRDDDERVEETRKRYIQHRIEVCITQWWWGIFVELRRRRRSWAVGGALTNIEPRRRSSLEVGLDPPPLAARAPIKN
ncbi:hypothetical protein Trydic_g21905 [Trypoxylus dichotomus]